jgi:hypothetical protein
VKELRSFWGSKESVKLRPGCKMYCESRRGNSTEEIPKTTKNILAFILWNEISREICGKYESRGRD